MTRIKNGRPTKREVRVPSRLARRAVIFGCITLASVGCSSFENFGTSILRETGLIEKSTFSAPEALVGEIGPEEEYHLGRAVAARILGLYPALEDQGLENYVALVGLAVAAASERPETFAGYSFAVLNTDEVNAISAPGGYIFITRGLLRRIESEDALAAVLAHEVTHVVNRDGLKAIAKEHSGTHLPLAGQAVCSLDCSGLAEQLTVAFSGAVDDIVDALLKKGYSREQEYAADLGAGKILVQAGYRPDALGDVLSALEAQPGQGGWFSTHPGAAERRSRYLAGLAHNSGVTLASAKRARRFRSAWNRVTGSSGSVAEH